MQLNRFTVILTAHRADRSEHGNDKAQAELTTFVADRDWFTFDVGQGRYEGVTEPVLAVQCKDFQAVALLVDAARRFEQESVMLVDARNKAFLLYTVDCRMLSLGLLFEAKDADLSIPLPVNHTILNGNLYYTV